MRINLEKFTEIISNYVDLEDRDVTEASRFIEDLGLNSYDFMSLLGELEDECDIEVNEREALRIHTVGEAIAYVNSLA